MLDTVKEGLLNLALLAYFCLLKHYTRKYPPPSFKSQNIWRNFIFSLQPTVRFFLSRTADYTFIALAGKKKCRPHLLRVNEGVKKCTMRQGPGRLQEGIFTSGVYIFHEETEERGFSFAVSLYSNQLLKFKHKITLRGWVIIIFWLVNLFNIRFILQ